MTRAEIVLHALQQPLDSHYTTAELFGVSRDTVRNVLKQGMRVASMVSVWKLRL